MNRSLIKRTAVILTAVALTAVPVFAKSGNHNDEEDDRRGAPCMDFDRGPRGMCAGFAGEEVKQTLGTVSAIDKKAGTITVTDADGNTSTVHINPLTAIFQKQLPPAPSSSGKNRPEPKLLTIDDLKEGDWVMIRSFNTGTKMLEAANILVSAK